MHVLFLAPDTHVYNHMFLEGLRAVGARVSAIGPQAKVSAAAQRLLDGYVPCARMLDRKALLDAIGKLPHRTFDRVETIDEPLVEIAAELRQALGVPGLSAATARLCRDKVAMKDLLRERGIPCAQAARATTEGAVREFAEREGFPVIVKPIAGFGSLETFRVTDDKSLTEALKRLPPSPERPVAVEEFIEGHEGFYDTITDADSVRHDFAAHYFPGCLEANQTRAVSPQILVTNRIEEAGYVELRKLGRDVIDALGIRSCATHMEWFFGPKGLKFSEIGARPAGEKIWDMYRFANEFDVFAEWARAAMGKASSASPSRRFASGHVQIRPDKDGRYDRHDGVEQAWQRCKPYIYEYELPKPGEPTKPLEKGWHQNTWFRLVHEDYDELRELLSWLGKTVQAITR